MAETSNTLTRCELYKRVWAVPLHRLCKEFSLSDRGLAKICARHKIPVPARGVWAIKAHGKPARQPPLPRGPSGSDDTIITISQSPPPDAASAGPAAAPPICSDGGGSATICGVGASRPTAAIIGSFRQHYSSVLEAWRAFSSNGISVSSPKGTAIIKDGVPFVRFESDNEDSDDPAVQTLALHRIMRADLVLVVAPGGYVGRTTCYEIGRIVQAQRPLYFTELPTDLPIRVDAAHVATPVELALRLAGGDWTPQPLFVDSQNAHDSLEQALLDGNLRTD